MFSRNNLFGNRTDIFWIHFFCIHVLKVRFPAGVAGLTVLRLEVDTRHVNWSYCGPPLGNPIVCVDREKQGGLVWLRDSRLEDGCTKMTSWELHELKGDGRSIRESPWLFMSRIIFFCLIHIIINTHLQDNKNIEISERSKVDHWISLWYKVFVRWKCVVIRT